MSMDALRHTAGRAASAARMLLRRVRPDSIQAMADPGEHLPAELPEGDVTIVRMSGGLANQMLCYKVGRYVAGLKQSALVLDASPYDHPTANPARNFQLASFPLRYHSLITSSRHMARIREGNPIAYVTREMIEGPSSTDSRGLVDFIKSNRVIYCDLWLAFRWRAEADAAAESNGAIADLTLEWEKWFDDRDRRCLSGIRESANPVAIHVRRGDFATHDGNLLVSASYYNRAIAELESRFDDPLFLVFSDDIAWCRANLRFTRAHQLVDWHDDTTAFKDMFLASQCAHFILSNESTFSHQVVQLCRNTDRVVITSGPGDLERNAAPGDGAR